MKKIVALVALAFIVVNANSQDRPFRFGLKIDPTISWLSPDNAKKFERQGTGFGFGFGANGEIAFSERFVLSIGAGLSFEKAGLSYSSAPSADTVYYALNADDELQTWDPSDSASVIGNSLNNNMYYLQSRSASINYVYIPVLLKMKTKEIGMMTYYGQFGLDIKIKTKARANDNVREYNILTDSYSGELDKSDLVIDSGVQPLALGLNIGMGTEYHVSDNTHLVMGLAYSYGLTNVLKKEDETLVQSDNNATYGVSYIEQQAAMHQIRITLGVLF